MPDMYIDATQTFDNSTSYIYPNEAANDPPLAENIVDGNSLFMRAMTEATFTLTLEAGRRLELSL